MAFVAVVAVAAVAVAAADVVAAVVAAYLDLLANKIWILRCCK